MKPYVPLLIFLLLVSTGFVGVSNTAEELVVEDEQHLNTSSSGPMDSAWPTKCHDNRHTGRSPYSTENVTGLEKWRYKAKGWVNAGIVIDDEGTIYFGENERYIYALNPDGTEKWKFGPTGGWTTSSPALSEDGTLYVATWDYRLYALNSSDGTQKWAFNAGGEITSSPVIAEDGTIYFGVMGPGYDKGRIYAVNPNGTEKWYYDTGYWITSDPSIDYDETIYCGSGDDYFYAFYPNGTLKWRYKTGDDVRGSASIGDDGTVYVGSFDGYLYAFYPENGTLKWKYGGIGPGTETNPSLAEDGTIYVGGEDLYAVYPNGTKKWNFDPGDNRLIKWSSPVVSSEGTIYFGTHIGDGAGGEIIAVNPNGTEKWRKKIAFGWVDSSPCIAEDGTVYIGCATDWGGYIHAFGPVESNSPPEAPTITGKLKGEPNMKYEYHFTAYDPDNNPLTIFIEWGDDPGGWKVEEHASGETCHYAHTWDEEGNYTIRAKVKDVLGEESDWGYLDVTMPKSYNPVWWLNNLLDRFPLLSRLLEWLTW